MADIHVHDDHNPEVHHEERDVPVKPLVWFGVAFAIFSVVTMLAMYFLFRFMAHQERGSQAAPLTSVAGGSREAMPADMPKLQPFPADKGKLMETPAADMKAMKAAQEKTLNSYGWVDPQRGVVHIPIDKAIDLVAASNLPVRPAVAPAAATAPATAPGAPATATPVMPAPAAPAPAAGGAPTP